MMYALRSREQAKQDVNKLFVDELLFPQNIAVIRTRMEHVGIEIVIGDYKLLI